ncbi:MAG: phosphotransferase [Actinomycetota bacterium]|nr:phosphotransferase [Actinomycetota bacterium]
MDVEANAVTGVIDWTGAAIADPVHDLALIYRDLGPEISDLTLDHYEANRDDADRERAVFYARCALLEDIAYGYTHRSRPLRGSRPGAPNPDLHLGHHVAGVRKIPTYWPPTRLSGLRRTFCSLT